MRVTVMILVACAMSAASAAAQDSASGADVLKHLTGTWKAPDDRTLKNSPLDEQVFGPGAAEVRTVTLVVSPSGDADLQIRRSVVGSKGKVFAPSITEVKMQIGEPVTTEFGHLKPTVTVKSAEERYLDGDHERWPRAGSRVAITFADPASKELNLQFETPDGRGAFGTTLKPPATSAGTNLRSRRSPS